LRAFSRLSRASSQAAQVHHGHATLVVLPAIRILFGRRFHALFDNAQMSASAIGKFPAWAFQNLLKLLLGALKFLL